MMKHEGDDTWDADQPEGRYANYLKVGHNAFEFLLDFGQFYPQSGQALLHTRLITAPVYAKAMLTVLQESMEQYEQTFGVIPDEPE